jgi:DNA-binding ferritin-like protein (Dps family)
MNSKDIIQLNNEMREQLSPGNKEIYEDMLVYIRLNSNKSEQQTEELLYELLEHILQGQKIGKTPKDIFGDDLRKYCDEIIDEIPGEVKSTKLIFGSYIIIYYLGVTSTMYGVLGYALYHLFSIGSNTFTFSLGSGIVTIIIELLILYVFLTSVFKWLKNSVLKEKKINKWVEFIQIWLICMAFIGIIILIPIIMPSFGTEITIPIVLFAFTGVILFFVAYLLNKKYRITK